MKSVESYITITECYVTLNCSCLPQFFFFLNLSVSCWLAVGRLSVTCRSTESRQLTDSRPTGFLGSSSSQLPKSVELEEFKEGDSINLLFFSVGDFGKHYECL